MEERHWAGSASLKFRESLVIPGFAQLEIAAEGTEPPWSGLFVAAEAQAAAITATSAELIISTEVRGPATVVTPRRGIFLLTGTAPAPRWGAMLDDGFDPEEGPRVLERDGYLEAVGPSRITVGNWQPVNELEPFPAGTRLLIDYRPVREILVPFDWFLAAGRGFAQMGVKVAVVADNPVAFGISRQTLLTAGVEEGRVSAVFRDYDEAREWLLKD